MKKDRYPIQKIGDDPDETMKELQAIETLVYGNQQLIQKADADVAVASTAYSTAPTYWNALFGRKLWSSLNFEKNVFAIIPKEVWKQSGWRMETGAALSPAHAGAEIVGGLAREGTLPETLEFTIVTNSTQPKEVIHDFATYEIYQFLSSIEDSVSILPYYRKRFGANHKAALNTMLVQSAEYLAKNSGANWAGTVNFESLDRLIASGAEETAIASSHDHYYDPYVAYGTSVTDRDAGTTFDSQVIASGGTLGTDGDLNLWDVEKTWRQVQEAGGGAKTDVILTGADTVSAFGEILEPERRFMGETKIVPTYNGVRGLGSGTEGAFSVSTYRSIPIITSIAVRCTDGTNGDTLSKMFFLDTSSLRLKIARPTRYLESTRDMNGFVAHNKLRVEGGFLTVGELVCYRFNNQGKLRDIK